MATTSNKNLSAGDDWVKQMYKDAFEKNLLPTPKEIRVLKRKRALRAFLKRVYLFILTAVLM
jgi:hypothetical protein